jgi:hypothetical protein
MIMLSLIKKKSLQTSIAALSLLDNMKRNINRRVKGAFAFEYIIILVLMVGIIFVAWRVLTPIIEAKINDIADNIQQSGV